MGTGRDKLSALAVRQVAAGKYGDGAGLWLVKSSKTSGSWVLRISARGRLRHMGLGSIADVGLKDARIEADKWRAVARTGGDPLKERERLRRAETKKKHLLRDVAQDAFESRKAELKGDGKSGRWFTPLELHVLPKLGDIPITEIDQLDIRDAVSPIWHTKAETARKAMNRLGIVMRHAAALGLDVDLQVVEKARALLGRSRHRAENIPAMRWQDVPTFYRSLRDDTVTHLALRLLILTGVRSAPLRHLHESHLSVETINGREIKVWTIPGALMKGRKDATADFRVPLSIEACAVVEVACRHARQGYLFPSTKRGVISDMTLGMYMRRMKLEARPHGFRSSLRDWLAEATDAPHEIAETILQHVAGNRVVRAYRRTDYLEQRYLLMERWANHAVVSNNRLEVEATSTKNSNEK